MIKRIFTVSSSSRQKTEWNFNDKWLRTIKLINIILIIIIILINFIANNFLYLVYIIILLLH